MSVAADFSRRAQAISLIIMDVDGTLTDGTVNIGANGELFKAFDIRDGAGISLWHKSGGQTAIITGRSSQIVANRAAELKIGKVYQGQSDKRAAYEDLRAELDLSDANIAFIGDDFIDIPLLRRAGLAIAVGDAAAEAKAAAQLVTAKSGGHGAVREAIEAILKAQGRWEELLAAYYRD